MNRLNRFLLASVVASGLCGGAGIAAGISRNIPVAHPLEEHWKHPEMHHAMESLKTAREELKSADDGLKGHRDKAIEEVDHAMQQIQEGLHEQHDESSLPSDLPRANPLSKHPHIDRGLEALQKARSDLSAASKIFGGHRDEAMAHVDNAIKHIEAGLHEE